MKARTILKRPILCPRLAMAAPGASIRRISGTEEQTHHRIASPMGAEDKEVPTRF